MMLYADKHLQKEYLNIVLPRIHILKITRNGEDVVRHPEFYMTRKDALDHVISVLALYQPPIVDEHGKRFFAVDVDDGHSGRKNPISEDDLLKMLTKYSGYRPYENVNGITIERLLDPVGQDDFYESDGEPSEDIFPKIRDPSYYWPGRDKVLPDDASEHSSDE